MKTITTILLLIITFSCSKNDPAPVPKVYPEENFLPTFLTNSGLSLYSTFIDENTNAEFGLAFKPLVKGKINSFIVRIPQANNVIRVTLWDKTTKNVITTENVSITATDGDISVVKVITPIQLEKDKEYVISFNTNDSYYYVKIINNVSYDVAYNVTCNNIIITDFLYENGSAQTFPSHSDANVNFFGNVSFNFQQTE